MSEMFEIISKIQCAPYRFRVGCFVCDAAAIGKRDGTHNCIYYLQAMLWRQDIITGEDSWGYGGKYYIDETMEEGEIVKKALTAALSYAEHEVRESFAYAGRRVFGPHIPVSALWAVAEEVPLVD